MASVRAGRRLAVMGAGSQMARDFILQSVQAGGRDLVLFTRNPDELRLWLGHAAAGCGYAVNGYDQLPGCTCEALINFVGVGDPARLAAMGAEIFDVTARYDDLALAYLKSRPECRYIFLSSGAVYGGAFLQPAGVDTPAMLPVNHIGPQDYYAVAKLHAEARHRSLRDLPIVDLRVFNYFSRTQDLQAAFLISQAVRAMLQRQVFKTAPHDVVRDFLHPADFHQLVDRVLEGPPANAVFDCYTGAPVSKLELLRQLAIRHGLAYEIDASVALANPTGAKLNYFTTDRRAAQLGYQPKFTALEGVLQEAGAILEDAGR